MRHMTDDQREKFLAELPKIVKNPALAWMIGRLLGLVWRSQIMFLHSAALECCGSMTSSPDRA